jgi:hypothetical protein
MSESHRPDVSERHGQACRERRLVLASRVDQPARAPRALGEDEARRPLRAARRTGSTRGRALLALLSGTGLRLAGPPRSTSTTCPLPSAPARRTCAPASGSDRAPSRCQPTPAACCGAGSPSVPGSCSASSPNWAPTPGWWTSARTPCGTPRRPDGCAPASTSSWSWSPVHSVTLPSTPLGRTPCPPTGSWPTDRKLAGAVEYSPTGQDARAGRPRMASRALSDSPPQTP